MRLRHVREGFAEVLLGPDPVGIVAREPGGAWRGYLRHGAHRVAVGPHRTRRACALALCREVIRQGR